MPAGAKGNRSQRAGAPGPCPQQNRPDGPGPCRTLGSCCWLRAGQGSEGGERGRPGHGARRCGNGCGAGRAVLEALGPAPDPPWLPGRGSRRARGAAARCLCWGCGARAETRGKETLIALNKNKQASILTTPAAHRLPASRVTRGEMRSRGRLGALWRPQNCAELGTDTGAPAGVGPERGPGARFGHGAEAREAGGARRPPPRISTARVPGFCRGWYPGSAVGWRGPGPVCPCHAPRRCRAARAARSAPALSGSRAAPTAARPCHRDRGSPGSARRPPGAAAPFSFSLAEQHRAPCRSSRFLGSWHRNAGRNSLKEKVVK